MDYILLQSAAARQKPQTQTHTIGTSSHCQPPQDKAVHMPQMVDITFAVLGQHSSSSKHLDDGDCLPLYSENDTTKGTPTQSIEVAVQILDRRSFDDTRGPLFESVRLTLHGAIKTNIGKYNAAQKVLQATEKLDWSAFTSSPDGQCIDGATAASTLYATISFMTNGMRLPSSTVLTGSKYVTEQTALSDQHLVPGRCEVQYWITAEPTMRPDTEYLPCMPRAVSSPLDLSFRPMSVHVEPSTSVAKVPTRLRLRESCNSVFAYCGYGRYTPCQAATIAFNVPKMAPISLIRSGGHDQPTCVVPLTMTITIPSPASAADAMRSTLLRHHLLQKGLKGIVSLSAGWNTNQCFSIGAAATEYAITTRHSSTIAGNVDLEIPPFYLQSSEQGEEYTATTFVDLNIPEALILDCSLDSSLLRTKHMLDLALSTSKLQMGSVLLLPACSAKLAADCSLS